MLLVLRLTGLAGDNIAIPVQDEHRSAGADDNLAVLRECKSARGAKLRKGEGAGEDVEEDDENAKGCNRLAPQRAAAPAWQSMAQLYPHASSVRPGSNHEPSIDETLGQ